MNDLEKISRKLEHFETPQWCVDAILAKEFFTHQVVDPCTGTGILAKAAEAKGYQVYSFDIRDWGYSRTNVVADWLFDDPKLITWVPFQDATCFMNPPFSLATQFVEKSIERKFRKIVCFQRFAWYESKLRQGFWDKYPPARVYICGDRASCWRHDISADQRAGSSTPTAHAWFVWDREHIGGTLLGRIYKETAR